MNVCMVAYSHFPSDVRIKREAEALVDKNINVDVICLKNEKEAKFDKINGINVYRIDIRKKQGSLKSYLIDYNIFGLISMLKLIQLNTRKRYDVIHIHNPPDQLVLSTLPLKILNKTKIVFDIHDPMGEIFASRFEKDARSKAVRFIKKFERLCCKYSDRIITVNDVIKENLKEMDVNNVSVVMNAVDKNLFSDEIRRTSKDQFGLDGRFIILYEGSVMKRRGIHTLIDAIAISKKEIPQILCLIVGDGDYLDYLREMVKQSNLQEYVMLIGRRPLEEIPKYVAIADVCVIPFARAPINEIGVPNKLFEYMIYEKPIIISKLKAMSSLLSDSQCYFFEPEDSESLANCILEIYHNPSKAKAKTENARILNEKYSWETMKERLYECYDFNN